MTEVIKEKLREIEEHENVRIIYSAESGSRAWGFASPDSDYDVRFIYVRPKEYYLRLERTRDVIEWQLDDTLDINGWDIQKALRLLHNSNPALFEWASSPIVYRQNKEWLGVWKIINEYFMKRAGLYHYVSTAKNNYREFLCRDTVRLKKYFYVLRPILACKWIMKYGTPPPMLFDELASDCLDPELKPAVDELLRIKRETPEINEGRRIDIINDYLNTNIESIRAMLPELPKEEKQGWEKLNSLFLSML